jgi:hypothetical protein
MSGRISFPGRIGARGRPSKYQRPAARGVSSPGRTDLQAVCAFDPETFEEIRALAMRAGISFRAQVRLLVEWGLEDVKREAAE